MFPDELKLANVLPLYKNDDSYVFNNYRPVSLLNVLSKVFEKVMYNRLIEFLENVQNSRQSAIWFSKTSFLLNGFDDSDGKNNNSFRK